MVAAPEPPPAPEPEKAEQHAKIEALIAGVRERFHAEPVAEPEGEPAPPEISYGCAHCGEGPTHMVKRYGQVLQICSRCDPPR